MFTHFHAKSAAWWRAVLLPNRPLSAIGIVACCLLATACNTVPYEPNAGRDPSDPASPVPAVGYRSTTASHVSQRPVAPVLWRRQNERVTPQPKSEQ